ncbi:MAG: SUMF1/EgtB/PvdO family nonheme iron enzyme, partial [Planctomycetota bacterium]
WNPACRLSFFHYDSATARPSAVWADEELVAFSSEESIELLPIYRSKPLVTWAEGRWSTSVSDGVPLVGVTMRASVEYAHWLSTHRYGGEFRFRLPSEVEWERAARGADRRAFVWGDYPAWSFCRSKKGRIGDRLAVRGHAAFDESVFGVRDMAGSLSEFTSSVYFGRLSIVRGGSWETLDDRDFRIASRNRRYPYRNYTDMTVRLVAERK